LYDLKSDYIASASYGTGEGGQDAGAAAEEEKGREGQGLVAEPKEKKSGPPSDAIDTEGEERHTCNTCDVVFEDLYEQVL
jgi:hypothetical protein